MRNEVLKNIINTLHVAKYYSVILDCTPDVNHREQLSFTVRIVYIKHVIYN